MTPLLSREPRSPSLEPLTYGRSKSAKPSLREIFPRRINGALTKALAEKSQLDKFKEAARDLECDDHDQRFKERLGKLVKPQNGDKSKK